MSEVEVTAEMIEAAKLVLHECRDHLSYGKTIPEMYRVMWETFDTTPLEMSSDIVVGYWDAGKWWTYQPRNLDGWNDLHARNGKGMNQAYWVRIPPPAEGVRDD